jgi:hypothetical protein
MQLPLPPICRECSDELSIKRTTGLYAENPAQWRGVDTMQGGHFPICATALKRLVSESLLEEGKTIRLLIERHHCADVTPDNATDRAQYKRKLKDRRRTS